MKDIKNESAVVLLLFTGKPMYSQRSMESSKYLFEKLGPAWKGSHFSLSGGGKQYSNTLGGSINSNKSFIQRC